jgi:hypothetical protein
MGFHFHAGFDRVGIGEKLTRYVLEDLFGGKFDSYSCLLHVWNMAYGRWVRCYVTLFHVCQWPQNIVQCGLERCPVETKCITVTYRYIHDQANTPNGSLMANCWGFFFV